MVLTRRRGKGLRSCKELGYGKGYSEKPLDLGYQEGKVKMGTTAVDATTVEAGKGEGNRDKWL